MTARVLVSALLCVLLSATAQAQIVAAPAGPSLRVKQLRQEMVLTPDGKIVTTTAVQMQVLNAAATNQFSQLPVNYNALLEQAEISDAYTLKADGEKIPVDPANILNQKVAQPALAPIYSDAEQKIIVFPRVEAGDTLVYTSKLTHTVAILNNQFTLNHFFSQAIEADDSTYSLTAPTAMHLIVASSGMKQDISTQGDQTVYRWSLVNTAAKARPTMLVFEPDTTPHFLVSSFKDYDGFAHYLASFIGPKVAVTPAIQKQADTVTAGITDRRLQARALYEWVSQHVRYVAIELGVGGIVPHDAEWTLNNGFGDCKDQAVLYASLLKAKGIDAQLVLINAGNLYKFSGVPGVGEFNHMIAWLPDFKIYADTTLSEIPFGTLPVPDYGKAVLHLVATGAAAHTTPLIPSGLLTSTYKVHAVQNAQGGFDVDVSVTATGPWAGTLHRLGDDVQKSGSAVVAAAVLKIHNTNAQNSSFTAGSGSDQSFTLTGAFRAGRPGPQANIFSLANTLSLLPRGGDYLMGPLANKTLTPDDETPCFNGHQVEDISVDFANGAHLAAIPADAHVKTANASYDTHWSQNGSNVTLHREFTTTIDQPICAGKVRQDMAGLLLQIRDDYGLPTRLAAAASN